MGYELISLTPERTPPLASAEVTAAWMNQIIEQCILMAPEQYMWLHRRFKTRPEGCRRVTERCGQKISAPVARLLNRRLY
jgi:lauroyl/myristoyl acyltransferase